MYLGTLQQCHKYYIPCVEAYLQYSFCNLHALAADYGKSDRAG